MKSSTYGSSAVIHDPLKQWEARARWTSSHAAAGRKCTKAKEVMLEHTHIPEARWWVIQAVDKKRARRLANNRNHKKIYFTPDKNVSI